MSLLLTGVGDGGRKYYVDATAGDDGNDGLSTAAPWKTIAKVNGSTFKPHAHVRFKCGEVWRETLTISTDKLKFGAYGTGANPLILGSTLKANASFVLESGTTYQIAHTTAAAPVWVWEDGVRLTPQASLADCRANAGSSYWASDVLYVHASDSSDVTGNGKAYEGTARSNCINCTADDCIFEDLELRYVGGTGDIIVIEASNNSVIRRCTVADCNEHPLQIGPGSTNITVEDCTFANGGSVVAFESSGCTIRRCVLKQEFAWATGSLYLQHGAGTTNNVVEYCDMYTTVAGTGTTVGVYNSDLAAGLTVRYNNIRGDFLSAIRQHAGATGLVCHSNRVYHTGLGKTVNILGGTTLLYNNTIYHAGGTFSVVYVTVGTLTAKNNVIYGDTLILEKTATGTLVSDYNVGYSSGSATPWSWETVQKSLADWRTASGNDLNSVQSDPLFTNLGTGDLSLQAGSPANGTGVDLGSGYDYLLDPTTTWPSGVLLVPQVTAKDCGAYLKA